MAIFGDPIVYRSKDEQDWEKAKALLEEAGIEMKYWIQEDAPAGGCGAKVDVRKFMNKNEFKKYIYKIEVAKKDEEAAKAVLKDKVKAPESYGLL